ncbi:MAG: DUF3000 domain-containing protein [Angustibacter sp.]
MVATTFPEDPPELFRQALAGLRSAVTRPEVALSEVPAPGRIAPYTVALSAEVFDSIDRPSQAADGEPLATGKFVVLHDPAHPPAWAGTFRAVTFVRAELEPDLGGDPLLGAVGWSWLIDALDGRGALYTREGGTVTRMMSESFAALAGRRASVEVEIRASWTPRDDAVDRHLLAWTDVLCTVAGLPPLPDGVRPLPRRSHR